LLGASNISYHKYQAYFAADARLYPLLMTWSLGVEEQFYVLFPFVMFGLARWANSNVDTVFLAGFWPLSDANTYAKVEHYQAVPPYTRSTDTTDLFRH
jgi:peptidoglycan/LPS O-acetylase OafA/YrhL